MLLNKFGNKFTVIFEINKKSFFILLRFPKLYFLHNFGNPINLIKISVQKTIRTLPEYFPQFFITQLPYPIFTGSDGHFG